MISRLISSFLIENPNTGKKDVILTISLYLAIVCGVRFLFDGVSIAAIGDLLKFGHVDSLSYTAILGPVFGAHAAMDIGGKMTGMVKTVAAKVDSPEDK